MKPELEIGMPAMIIGCKRPENSYLIGTVVKVEAFWNKGDDITSFYIGAKESGTTVRCNTSAAVVSESKFTILKGILIHLTFSAKLVKLM